MTHPLGYRKINLTPQWRWWRIRLHVWRPGAQVSDKPHDHRWGFVSLPLWGRFVDTRYERTGELAGVDVAVPDRGAGRRYLPSYEPGIEQVSQALRRPPLPYRCRIGEIHSYVPAGSGWHVSLVFTGRERTTSSRVWSHPEESA